MSEQPTPRIFDAVWRHRWTSLVIVLAIAVLSVGVSYLVTTSVTATARIVLKTPDKAGLIGVEAGSEAAFIRHLNQRSLFVTSGDVLRGAVDELGGDTTTEQLRKDISATASNNQEAIVVEAVAASAQEAQAKVDAIIASYRDVAREEVAARAEDALEAIEGRRQRIENSVPENEGGARAQAHTQAAAQSLSELDSQATEISIASEQVGDGVAFVYPAVIDDAAGLRSTLRDGAIGLGLGLVLAAGVAWVREDRDQQLLDAEGVTGAATEPVFGEIERLPHDTANTALRELTEQPITEYRIALAGMRQIIDRGLIVVTGVTPECGCTTSALQLAKAAARGGLRVLVVDGSVRDRGLTRMLYADDSLSGLTDLTEERVDLRDAAYPVSIGGGAGFWAVSAGASDVVRESQLRALLDQMRAAFDLVIVDAPPPSRAPEATRLVQAADGVVLVVRHGTKTSELLRLRRQLTTVGADVAGYVLNFLPQRSGPRGRQDSQ